MAKTTGGEGPSNRTGGRAKSRATKSRVKSSEAVAGTPSAVNGDSAETEMATTDARKRRGASVRKRSAGTETERKSRRELVDRVFARIEEKLDSDEVLSQATIGSLVQLLKLEREIIEEEPPHEIRVVWQDKNGESSSEG